jgi:hypothetical protein
MSNASQSGEQGDRNNATSPTTFGRSVESQAQIADAQTIATGTEAGEELNIYRLVPIAPANDARWHGQPPMAEVVVAARTPGDARIVAAGAELDFMEVDAVPAEDVTTRNGSLFRDEKAFTVIAVEFGRRDLQRGVLEGQVNIATIKPVQE